MAKDRAQEPAARQLPQPLKWALLVAAILAVAYIPFVLFYDVVVDASANDREAEGAEFAAEGHNAESAFHKAIGIAPDCKTEEVADPCELQGKIFLQGYLTRAPEANRELCGFVEKAPDDDVAAWAEDRCLELGHDQGACREVHLWLTEQCRR